MARSEYFARLELHSHWGSAALAGGLGHGVLAQAGWDAERVDSAPGPEWSAVERQTVLSCWDRRQPVCGHDEPALIDNQGTSDQQFDVLGRNASCFRQLGNCRLLAVEDGVERGATELPGRPVSSCLSD
jgi:hypothetical protein